MDLQTLRRLYEFNAWADRRTLESCAVLTPEQFTRDMKSSFHSVRDTLVHIFGAEWIWLERWEGRSPTALPWAPNFPDFESVRARWQEVELGLRQFVGGLTQADLDRVLERRTMAGGVFRQPLWEMMQHVVNHGSYHRGQIATMLRQHGAQPAVEDLVLFYRESKTTQAV
jgi:uncharacterized damage-inducible protein DinB